MTITESQIAWEPMRGDSAILPDVPLILWRKCDQAPHFGTCFYIDGSRRLFDADCKRLAWTDYSHYAYVSAPE